MFLSNFLSKSLILVLLLGCCTASLYATSRADSAYSWANLCIAAPPLPLPGNRIINVDSEKELQSAVRNLMDNSTIVIEPGTYQLTEVLAITADDVTIRGAQNTCNSVELIGPGMENQRRNGVDNAFWIKAKNTTIANLSVGEFYFHTVQIDHAAIAPRIYNVRLFNSGQQFIKANPAEFGVGVDYGVVEYSIMEYTDAPPVTDHNGSGTGYTNGVDIHAGSRWIIRNNIFRNFSTPDNADHLWNAAVLAWNGASDTITENNTFIDVDRAIAYGLEPKGHDHSGGIIRNNMIVMTPNLYSDYRTNIADAPVVVWDSPGTKVLHNSILTSGNTPLAIEARFDSDKVEISNNLADSPVAHRDDHPIITNNNLSSALPSWFMNPAIGNLRLRPEAAEVINQTRQHKDAIYDADGQKDCLITLIQVLRNTGPQGYRALHQHRQRSDTKLDVQAATEHTHTSFLKPFTNSRMCMHGCGNIFCACSHLNGQCKCS